MSTDSTQLGTISSFANAQILRAPVLPRDKPPANTLFWCERGQVCFGQDNLCNRRLPEGATADLTINSHAHFAFCVPESPDSSGKAEPSRNGKLAIARTPRTVAIVMLCGQLGLLVFMQPRSFWMNRLCISSGSELLADRLGAS